ncbi:hypothetical protein [Streptococcus equi]|uniref:hypothetical protein n=1 Tax=Streptococcus equi TaxID=1336 RepID=UPI001E467E63|nr:hypothetical protein [Streptococcus equi]MCD3442658.1 hypothetical protein [Streptococcus equi subsp. zooepidemicus]
MEAQSLVSHQLSGGFLVFSTRKWLEAIINLQKSLVGFLAGTKIIYQFLQSPL